MLKNVEGKDRTAFYECDICFYDGTEPQFFIGKCYGTLGYERKGVNGFGYDPIFVPCGENKPFSLLPDEIKNEIIDLGYIQDKKEKIETQIEKVEYIFLE